MASVTAKTLVISFMPTASSMPASSGTLAELGGPALSTGNGERATAVDVVGGQRGHRVLLVRDAPLVVARDHHVAPQFRRIHPALGDPSLAGWRRERQRRRAAHGLLAHLLERAGG